MGAAIPMDSLQHAVAPPPATRSLSALTPTSWFAGRELAVAEWVEQGRCLGAIGRGSNWWIGDWIRYGSARYGDKYAAASRVTGYDEQSLMNMSYVAGRFDASRRRASLSFSHHAELAGLPPDDQELWLDRAEAGALSVRVLRAELRKARRRSSARTQAAEGVVCPHCGHQFGR
jgi:hypothetical protein